MWVRGLKLVGLLILRIVIDVAPRVGAWIETYTISRKRKIIPSHPVWVRGLKQKTSLDRPSLYMSHPVWVRGLKLLNLPLPEHDPRRTPCGCVD